MRYMCGLYHEGWPSGEPRKLNNELFIKVKENSLWCFILVFRSLYSIYLSLIVVNCKNFVDA